MKVWAGTGSAKPCDACEQQITATEIEVEVEVGRAILLRLHERCFRVWQDAVRIVPGDTGSTTR